MVQKISIQIVDRYTEELDFLEALINFFAVIKDGDIIGGSPHPLSTYPSGHHKVAFHRVWILTDDCAPEANKELPEFLLNLGYNVRSYINNFVTTKVEISCVQDRADSLGFAGFNDCYRFELTFDTDKISVNLTKEAFESVILELRMSIVAKM